jgi:hypothetical protein
VLALRLGMARFGLSIIRQEGAAPPVRPCSCGIRRVNPGSWVLLARPAQRDLRVRQVPLAPPARQGRSDRKATSGPKDRSERWERAEPATEGSWVTLDGASVVIPSQPIARTAQVTFWAASACFGVGAKYAQLYVDGSVVASTPLAPVPNSGFSEMQSSITQVVPILADHSPEFSVKVQTAPSTYCVLTEGNWSLSAVVAAA